MPYTYWYASLLLPYAYMIDVFLDPRCRRQRRAVVIHEADDGPCAVLAGRAPSGLVEDAG